MTDKASTTEERELLPCPFCGSVPVFDHDDDGWHWIQCQQCGITTNASTHCGEDCRPKLAEVWNRRAALAAPLVQPTEAPRGTDVQILKKRELTVSAINGAMAFGEMDTNPPPEPDHWLAPFWHIEQRLRAASPYRCTRCGRYEDGSRPCPNWDSACPVAAPVPLVQTHNQGDEASVSVGVLRQHWLRAMECDHATGKDKPHCSCSQVDLGWHPSIGAAVEAWLAHVVAAAPVPMGQAESKEGAKSHGWTCFHCGETFTDEASAREHFGSSQAQQPACTIDIAEYRRTEEAFRRSCEEDTDLHRELHRKDSEHQQALRLEEEKGYERGLRDGVKAYCAVFRMDLKEGDQYELYHMPEMGPLAEGEYMLHAIPVPAAGVKETP